MNPPVAQLPTGQGSTNIDWDWSSNVKPSQKNESADFDLIWVFIIMTVQNKINKMSSHWWIPIKIIDFSVNIGNMNWMYPCLWVVGNVFSTGINHFVVLQFFPDLLNRHNFAYNIFLGDKELEDYDVDEDNNYDCDYQDREGNDPDLYGLGVVEDDFEHDHSEVDINHEANEDE